MRALIGLALGIAFAGCSSAPATTPQPVQRTTPDNTCENVAWSCVGMKPNTEEAWGCIEGTAEQLAQYQASCTDDKHGRFALNPCLRDNLVGGCTVARGNQCTTTWYYAPATRQSIEADCAKQAALYVAP
jgi:hypothetical protein